MRRSTVVFSLCTALAVAAHSPVSIAADAEDQVVVTATRTRQSLENVIGSVTVITREEIEQQQGRSVQDVLRQQVGFDLTSQGGFGKLTALFIRGTEPEHVLVLVDGVRIGSITAGTNPFEYIPLEQIERIEIVRGPRSSLYGSDAIGGVIHIFTRGGGDRASLTIGGGSQGTSRETGELSMNFGGTWFAVSGTHFKSDGFNACKGSNSGGCFTIEPDKDGFRNVSGSARVGQSWGEIADVELGALYSKGHNEYDGSFANQTDFREFTPSFRGHVELFDIWDLTATAGFSRDDQDNFKDGRFSSYFNSERRSASLQSDLAFSDLHILTLGYDYLDDQVASTTLFDVKTRDNQGVFAQYQAGLGSHRLSASGRRDDNEQFGTNTTGNAGWKWLATEHASLMATVGTAFRAPSFNDLYYPGFSNPNLEPEESRSYEVGVEGQDDVWHGTLNLYQNEIDDLIELDGSFRPANVAKARIRGAELTNSFSAAGWDLSLGYSYTDPRNRTPGINFDKVLLRRARHSGSVEVAYGWSQARAGVIVRGQGPRFNNSANTSELPGYVTADLTGEYHLTKQLKFEAKLGNILDKSYETVRFYNEAPRTLFISIKYQPDFAN
jgi:vitamin B12 transporter